MAHSHVPLKPTEEKGQAIVFLWKNRHEVLPTDGDEMGVGEKDPTFKKALPQSATARGDTCGMGLFV